MDRESDGIKKRQRGKGRKGWGGVERLRLEGGMRVKNRGQRAGARGTRAPSTARYRERANKRSEGGGERGTEEVNNGAQSVCAQENVEGEKYR